MPIRTRTSNIYNTAAEEDARFRGRFGNDVPKKWLKEDEQRTPMALFVVDAIPLTTIREILNDNEADLSHACLWLADTYDTLPNFDYHPETPGIEGTDGDEVEESWTSPFLGSSAEDCLSFIRAAPRPPKGLNIKFCAIVQKARYEADGTVLVAKWRGEKKPQTIPCHADKLALFYLGYERDEWKESHRMRILH